MSRITINGATYQGNDITIDNGKIFIDGVEAETEAKEINISIQGSIYNLRVDTCNTITVDGNVGSIGTMSGDVKCNNVFSYVNTMSGDVSAEVIHGKVTTMSGDINQKG